MRTALGNDLKRFLTYYRIAGPLDALEGCIYEMLLKSSPAFSIGTSHRSGVTLPTNDNPGPASYTPDIDLKRASPRPVIGKADKHPFESPHDAPGPGNYLIKSSLGHAPRAILTSRKRVNEDEAASHPGPADYDPRPPAERIAYTFGLKTELVTTSRDRLKTPGPGAYNPVQRESLSPRAVYALL